MKLVLTLLSALLVLVVAVGCGGRAAAEPVATVTTTAPPTTIAPATPPQGENDPTADPLYAGLPSNIATAMLTADPTRGQELTTRYGCIGCHVVDPNVKMAGPTWHNLATVAATRVEGQSAALYLYHSIANPNDYLVEGYPAGLMVQTFSSTLSDQEMADILVYLLSLGEKN